MENNVYVLKLESEKYYVGRSSNLRRRIRQHFSGRGSAWTRLHPPKRVVEVIRCNSELDSKRRETEYYYRYKRRFGRDNVRGAGNTRSK